MASQASSLMESTAQIRITGMYGDHKQIRVTQDDSLYTVLEKAKEVWQLEKDRLFFLNYRVPNDTHSIVWGQWGAVEADYVKVRINQVTSDTPPEEHMKLLQLEKTETEGRVAIEQMKKIGLSRIGLLSFAHTYNVQIMVVLTKEEGEKLMQLSDEGKART